MVLWAVGKGLQGPCTGSLRMYAQRRQEAPASWLLPLGTPAARPPSHSHLVHHGCALLGQHYQHLRGISTRWYNRVAIAPCVPGFPPIVREGPTLAAAGGVTGAHPMPRPAARTSLRGDVLRSSCSMMVLPAGGEKKVRLG